MNVHNKHMSIDIADYMLFQVTTTEYKLGGIVCIN